MSPELATKFESLNARIDTTVSRILAYPDGVRNAPAGKSFAPALVPSHFAIVDGMWVTAFESTKGKVDHTKVAKPRFLFGLINKAMRKPVGKTVPAPASMAVVNSDPSAEAEKWRTARATIISHLSDVDDDKVATKHPLFGAVSPNHLLEILTTHHDYHDARLP
jgi:hypothetical protein